MMLELELEAKFSFNNRHSIQICIPGMIELLQKVQWTVRTSKNKCHFIIISGSNDCFVGQYLSSQNPPLSPNVIISNHATLTEDEPPALTFEPYEDQHTCTICPRFLCKGQALEDYIAANGPFDQVYYVGDGQVQIMKKVASIGSEF
jgi:hypothetical protein